MNIRGMTCNKIHRIITELQQENIQKAVFFSVHKMGKNSLKNGNSTLKNRM